MDYEQRKAILKSYGRIGVCGGWGEYKVYTSWLYSENNQRCCKGKGATTEEAIESLYSATIVLLGTYARAGPRTA